MPDATGLELIRQELGAAVLDTSFFRERATLVVEPPSIRAVLGAPARARATRPWRACTASTTTRRSRAWASSTSCST